MLPRIPVRSPAFFAREFSGETPIARAAISAWIFPPLRRISIPFSFSEKASTAEPRRRFIPFLRISEWMKAAISESKGERSCFALSIRVTSIPRFLRFSASSTPTKPPPITAADFGFSEFAKSLIRKVSSTVRRVKIFSEFTPGIGGTEGFAPGARRSLSYFSSKMFPFSRFFTETVFAFGFMSITSWRVFISTRKRRRKLSGVWRVSSEGSVITSPI